MGGAMLQGWLSRGLSGRDIAIVDPGPPPEVRNLIDRHAIALNPLPADIAPPSLILLAVKPQIMADILPAASRYCGPDTLVVSIAAGWTIANFEAGLPDKQPIVRVMPNTPASIGQGMLVAYPNALVTDQQRQLCDNLLAVMGLVAWIEDEALMDAVTAVSGSGPAYIFHLAECLEQAAIAAGLPAELSRTLARTTVCGAGALLGQSALDADELRRNVTSPGGTTAAALSVLMKGDALQHLMGEAVAAAKERSKDLSA